MKAKKYILIVLAAWAALSMGLFNFRGYVQFSDWRGVKVDYATNKYVANFYGSQSEYYRPAQYRAFVNRIARGDTLTVGLDYYALSVSSQIVPQEILTRFHSELATGRVLVFKVYAEGGRMMWAQQ